jgi:hypothetical protein
VKYFKPYEVVSRKQYELTGDSCLGIFNPELLMALDDLREYFGVPITVNNWHSGGSFEYRGFRTLVDQLAVNPKSKGHSAHQLGEAIDCDIQDHSAEQARIIILENKDNPLLRRITRMEDKVNWLHFDIRKLPVGVPRIHLFKS